MDDIFGRLQFLAYSARMVGQEIHVNAHGVPLIIRESNGRYAVSHADGHQITRMCNDPDHVVSEVKDWRA